MSTLFCGGCDAPMSETYARLKSDWEEIMEHLTHYGEELEADNEESNTDDKEHSIDEWYEYLTYWTSFSLQENLPTHEPAVILENPLAPDGSPLPPIQEGENEDNYGYGDDYPGYYANYLTESYDASDSIIPSIAALEARSSSECRRTELLALAD